MPIPGAGLEPGDVFGGVAEAGFGHGKHLVGASKEVEVVDVNRAEADLEGFVEVGQGNAQVLGRGPVDIDEKLGGIGAESGDDGSQPGFLVERVDEQLGGTLERGQARPIKVLDLDFKTA